MKKNVSRRNFLKGGSLGIIGGVTVIGGLTPLLLNNKSNYLRPPGALEESLFLSSCIKCGQCLQVCPPEILHLATITSGFSIGTPYITPSEGGCILCKGLPCVLACPTGALDHDISEGKEAEMGLAVLSSPKTCLSINDTSSIGYRLEKINRLKDPAAQKKLLQTFLEDELKNLQLKEKGPLKDFFSIKNFKPISIDKIVTTSLEKGKFSELKRFFNESKNGNSTCTICLDVCPIKEEGTITFEANSKNQIVPIVQPSCVGCGMCEEKCPTQKPSITITPRLTWDEKNANT